MATGGVESGKDTPRPTDCQEAATEEAEVVTEKVGAEETIVAVVVEKLILDHPSQQCERAEGEDVGTIGSET